MLLQFLSKYIFFNFCFGIFRCLDIKTKVEKESQFLFYNTSDKKSLSVVEQKG